MPRKKTKAVAKPSPYPPWQLATTGRPTTYNPEYCDRAIALGSMGKCSLAELGAEFGTSKETIRDWMAGNQPFADAIKRARTLAEAYWMNAYSQQALTNGKQLAQGYACFDMKNRFGWTDQREIAHTHTVAPAKEAWAQLKGQLKQIDGPVFEVDYEEIETGVETDGREAAPDGDR